MGVSGEENVRYGGGGAIVSKALENGYPRADVKVVGEGSSEFVPKE